MEFNDISTVNISITILKIFLHFSADKVFQFQRRLKRAAKKNCDIQQRPVRRPSSRISHVIGSISDSECSLSTRGVHPTLGAPLTGKLPECFVHFTLEATAVALQKNEEERKNRSGVFSLAVAFRGFFSPALHNS